MASARARFGLVLFGVLLLVGCGDDTGLTSDEVSGCVTLCDKTEECEIAVPMCLHSCGVLVLATERESLECSRAFDALPACAGGVTCEQLQDSISGGEECASARQACNEACGPGYCDLQDALFFDQFVSPPFDPF